MALCVKCLIESDASDDQFDEYDRLIESHKCTPEQQAGEDAELCETCTRYTIQTYNDVCMTPGCKGNHEET